MYCLLMSSYYATTIIINSSFIKLRSVRNFSNPLFLDGVAKLIILQIAEHSSLSLCFHPFKQPYYPIFQATYALITSRYL